MKFTMKGQKGFSLVELMVVVGIIGILASLAMPRLQIFMAKAKQAEARTNLGTLATLMESYRTDQPTYVYTGATLANIGFTQPGGARYGYTIPTVNAADFIGRGISTAILCTGAGSVDTWDINQTRALSNTSAATSLTCN